MFDDDSGDVFDNVPKFINLLLLFCVLMVSGLGGCLESVTQSYPWQKKKRASLERKGERNNRGRFKSSLRSSRIHFRLAPVERRGGHENAGGLDGL